MRKHRKDFNMAEPLIGSIAIVPLHRSKCKRYPDLPLTPCDSEACHAN